MTQPEPDWAARAVKVIAGEVARYRQLRRPRMSTKQLAARCKELGLEINRSVLANLESGRRHTLSVPELLVLAEALEVAPVLLIAPVHDEKAEILPGRTVDPWDAVMWLGGEGDRDVYLAQLHSRRVEQWRLEPERLGLSTLPRPEGLGDDPMVEQLQISRDYIEKAIRQTRKQMRERGMRPPALPPELAHVEAGEPA